MARTRWPTEGYARVWLWWRVLYWRLVHILCCWSFPQDNSCATEREEHHNKLKLRSRLGPDGPPRDTPEGQWYDGEFCINGDYILFSLLKKWCLCRRTDWVDYVRYFEAFLHTFVKNPWTSQQDTAFSFKAFSHTEIYRARGNRTFITLISTRFSWTRSSFLLPRGSLRTIHVQVGHVYILLGTSLSENQ